MPKLFTIVASIALAFTVGACSSLTEPLAPSMALDHESCPSGVAFDTANETPFCASDPVIVGYVDLEEYGPYTFDSTVDPAEPNPRSG